VGRDSHPQRLKPSFENKAFIAAVNRCATQSKNKGAFFRKLWSRALYDTSFRGPAKHCWNPAEFCHPDPELGAGMLQFLATWLGIAAEVERLWLFFESDFSNQW
jgi:hypothetical protein